jgi:hypothetical protein
VTDTAVGEAAWCCLNDLERVLVSFSPSDWLQTPLTVRFVDNDFPEARVDVANFWEVTEIERFLGQVVSPAASWQELESIAIQRFAALSFVPGCFAPLEGHPFMPPLAERILTRLAVLDRLHSSYDEVNRRTTDGHYLYQQHFTGANAWFSDSSDSEKAEFRRELSFRIPAQENREAFCSWHGKIRSPQIRIHFTWPVSRGEPLFIAYVGPKITKR